MKFINNNLKCPHFINEIQDALDFNQWITDIVKIIELTNHARINIFNYKFDKIEVKNCIAEYKLVGVKSMETLMNKWNGDGNEAMNSMDISLSQCITIKQRFLTLVAFRGLDEVHKDFVMQSGKYMIQMKEILLLI